MYLSSKSDGTDTGRAGIAPPDDPSVADQPAGPADVSITMPPDATITASPVEIVAIESGEDRPVDPEPVPEITSLKSPVESGLPETDLAASMPDSSADAAKPPPTRPMEEESASDESAESIAAADRAVEAFLNFQGSEKQRRGQLVKTYAQIAVACDLAAGESDSLRALAERLGNSSIRG